MRNNESHTLTIWHFRASELSTEKGDALIYGTSTSSFPDDGYGVSTDNPPSPYELIDEHLKAKDEQNIYEAWVEFREEIASRYFNTNEWDDYWWDAWIDKLKELI